MGGNLCLYFRVMVDTIIIIMYEVYTPRIWDCKSRSGVCKLKQITVDNRKYSNV